MVKPCCKSFPHLPPHSVARAILRRVARKLARMNGDPVAVAVKHVETAYDIAVDGTQGRLDLDESR